MTKMAMNRLLFHLSRVTHQKLMPRMYMEQKVNVYGMQINTVQCGQGEKSLLLMPGALGSAWTDFEPQIDNLPKLLPNYTIIVMEPPGCGKSVPAERKFGTDLFQADAYCALDLMQTLQRNSFSVLGWDTGGTTSLMLAGRFPEFVEKLIVCGSSAYYNEEELRRFEALRGLGSTEASDMRTKLEQFYGSELFAEKWACYIDAVRRILQEQKGDVCRTEVDCIQAPTLILRGENDPIVTKEHVKFLIQRIKNAKFYQFPDGNHDIHLRYADEFNKRVSDFLLEKPK